MKNTPQDNIALMVGMRLGISSAEVVVLANKKDKLLMSMMYLNLRVKVLIGDEDTKVELFWIAHDMACLALLDVDSIINPLS